MYNFILLLVLQSGDFPKQGCQNIPKKSIISYILLILRLNKFPKIYFKQVNYATFIR